MSTADYVSLNKAQVAADDVPFAVSRYRQFARHLPPSARRVLDIGCATGIGGATLREVRPDVDIVGLDCVPHRLELIPAGAYSQTICGLSTDIPLPDHDVDAVLAGEFIEHLTYADVLPTLAEFERVLRPGGRLLMTTPNPDSLKIRLRRGTMLGGAHLSAHYPKQLAQMMVEVGFGPASWCGAGKAMRLVGERFPLFSLYGAFLIWAESPVADA